MDFMQYLTTRTATLLTELDKRLLVVLRDGRTLIGELSCVDQFANLVLTNSIERIHVGKKFGDIHRGDAIGNIRYVPIDAHYERF